MPKINIAKNNNNNNKETKPNDGRFQLKSPSSVPLNKEISLDDSDPALSMGLKYSVSVWPVI